MSGCVNPTSGFNCKQVLFRFSRYLYRIIINFRFYTSSVTLIRKSVPYARVALRSLIFLLFPVFVIQVFLFFCLLRLSSPPFYSYLSIYSINACLSEKYLSPRSIMLPSVSNFITKTLSTTINVSEIN